MFNFSSGLFISFRFAKYSNTRLKTGQNTLTWSSSVSIIWVSSKSRSSIDTSSKTESSENDCNWVVGDWVVKLLTDSSAMLTNCSECYTLGSNRKPPEIWLTAAKNVTVGWGLNFRVRMLLKNRSNLANWETGKFNIKLRKINISVILSIKRRVHRTNRVESWYHLNFLKSLWRIKIVKAALHGN